MRAIRHALSPTSFGRLHLRLCSAGFRRSAERVSWNSVRYSWSSSRPAVVRISVSANPGVNRCWRCVDHDRDRRADRRLRRSWHPAMRRGTLDLNKLVHRSGGGIGRALLRGPTRARQGHTGLEQAARRGPADDPLADPERNALLRAQQRGADRRVALGRRCPAACSRGMTLTSGVTGGPQIQTSTGVRAGRRGRRSRDHRAPSVRTLALRRS